MGVVMLLGVAGCAAGDDGSVADESKDNTASAGSELKMRSMDDFDTPTPGPIDVPVPGLENRLKRPVWDLHRYLDNPEQTRFDFDQCYQYMLKIFDPARGKNIEVPVTVCS